MKENGSRRSSGDGARRLPQPSAPALCTHCTMRGRSVFNVAPSDLLSRLDEIKRVTACEKGQRICNGDDMMHGIHCVHSGSFKVVRAEDREHEFIMRFATAGDILGYFLPSAEGVAPVQAVALEASSTCFFPLPALDALFQSEPQAALALIRRYNHELLKMERLSYGIARLPVEARVAFALVLLLEAFGTHGSRNNTLRIRLKRHELASMIGTTKEQVSRTINRFAQQGLVSTKASRIDLLDVPALRQLTGSGVFPAHEAPGTNGARR